MPSLPAACVPREPVTRRYRLRPRAAAPEARHDPAVYENGRVSQPYIELLSMAAQRLCHGPAYAAAEDECVPRRFAMSCETARRTGDSSECCAPALTRTTPGAGEVRRPFLGAVCRRG